MDVVGWDVYANEKKNVLHTKGLRKFVKNTNTIENQIEVS